MKQVLKTVQFHAELFQSKTTNFNEFRPELHKTALQVIQVNTTVKGILKSVQQHLRCTFTKQIHKILVHSSDNTFHKLCKEPEKTFKRTPISSCCGGIFCLLIPQNVVYLAQRSFPTHIFKRSYVML